MGSQFYSTFAVLQFVGLLVLSVISYFLKRSLGDLDDLESKVETLQREAARYSDIKLVDQKIDTLRTMVDTRIDNFRESVDTKIDGLKEVVVDRVGDLNTKVAVIIDRDRMRRLEDYDTEGSSRRGKKGEI